MCGPDDRLGTGRWTYFAGWVQMKLHSGLPRPAGLMIAKRHLSVLRGIKGLLCEMYNALSGRSYCPREELQENILSFI
jgi:hypothetical protein